MHALTSVWNRTRPSSQSRPEDKCNTLLTSHSVVKSKERSFQRVDYSEKTGVITKDGMEGAPAQLITMLLTQGKRTKCLVETCTTQEESLRRILSNAWALRELYNTV